MNNWATIYRDVPASGPTVFKYNYRARRKERIANNDKLGQAVKVLEREEIRGRLLKIDEDVYPETFKCW